MGTARSVGILSVLATIPGAFGIWQAFVGMSAAHERPADLPAAIAPASPERFDIEKPLRDYLGLPKSAAPVDTTPSKQVAEALAPHDPIVLIATIPDPIDSTHGYRFDFFYSAIQVAIGEAGFTLDRFTFPWQKGSDGPEKTGGEGSKDRKAGSRRRDPSRNRERWPGVVLFRKAPEGGPDGTEPKSNDPSRERLLILLIIGETSTWGIHKEAFTECLRFRRKLYAGTPRALDPVLVLGPSFTGSASSLRLAITNWMIADWRSAFEAAPAWAASLPVLPPGFMNPSILLDSRRLEVLLNGDSFIIHSGSATGIDRDAFEGLGPPGRSRPRVDFQTTVHNEETLLRRLIVHLSERNRLPPTPQKIAILAPPESALEQKIESFIEAQSKGGLEAMFLPLPLHLSQAQSVFGFHDLMKMLQNPESLESRSASALGFGVDSETGDAVPLLSSSAGVTARVELLLLAKTLATISREDIRYVGVLSSDARDKIFLVQLIARFCPDVQVFFSSNDMLLTFPDFGDYLQGALVSSTYPMFSPSQLWDFGYGGKRRRFTFSSEFDQGCYNATLLLIDEANGNRDANLKGKLFEKLLDYGPPNPLGKKTDDTHTVPPVWISIVGKHGPWPVAVYSYTPETPDKDEDPIRMVELVRTSSPTKAEAKPAGLDDPRTLFTLPWILQFVAVSLVCLMFCHCYVQAFPRRHDPSATMPKWNHVHLAIVDYFRPLADPTDSKVQRRYIAMLFYVMLAAYALMSWPGLLPFKFDLLADPLKTLGGLALFVSLGSLLVTPLLPWRGRAEKLRSSLRTLYRPGLLVLAGVLLYVYHAVMAVAVPIIGFCTVGAIMFVLSLNSQELSPIKEGPFWFWEHLGRTPGPGGSKDRKGLRRARFWTLLMLGLLLAGVVFDLFVTSRSPENLYLLEGYFTFQRTVHFGSSVSPSIAIVLLGAAMMCWPLCQLRRLRLNNLFRVENPFSPEFPGARPGLRARLDALHKDLVATVVYPCRTAFRRPLSMAIAIAFVIFLFQVAYRFIPSVEGPVFNFLTAATLVIGPFLFLFVLLHTYRILGQYRELLRQLAMIPMAGAYERLPLKVAFTFGRYLSTFTPRVSNLLLVVQQYESLVKAPRVPEPSGRSDPDFSSRRIAEARDTLLHQDLLAVFNREMGHEDDPLRLAGEDYSGPFRQEGEVMIRTSHTMKTLVLGARTCLVPLQTCWEERSAAQGFVDAPQHREGGEGAGGRECSAGASSDGGPSQEATTWLARAEEFVALVAVTYVSQFALHLRNNVSFLTASPLLMLVAVNTYPFQPHRLLALFFWTLSLATLLVVMFFMVILDRDEFLSRIAKTRPSYFSWSSIPTFLKYLVPLVGILVTQHPDVSEFLYTYFGPVFRVIEK